MDNINKIISFILGLIVVIVFIAIVTGKFKIGSGIKNISKAKVTPTVTTSPNSLPTKAVTITYNTNPQTTTPISAKVIVPTYTSKTPTTLNSTNQYRTVQTTGVIASNTQIAAPGTLSTIPNTGAPTLLIPTALSMLGSGVFLKRKSNKK